MGKFVMVHIHCQWLQTPFPGRQCQFEQRGLGAWGFPNWPFKKKGLADSKVKTPNGQCWFDDDDDSKDDESLIMSHTSVQWSFPNGQSLEEGQVGRCSKVGVKKEILSKQTKKSHYFEANGGRNSKSSKKGFLSRFSGH